MKQKYKDLIKSIRNTIYKYKIDWDICESYVKKLSPVINEQLDDECILSDFMYDFSRGDRLLKFVRLFLENGFDVNGNNGRNGALCLHELCWSTYDEYILQIAEVLLDKGADSTLPYDENEESKAGVLNTIAAKMSYWTIGSCETANLFTAYYKMIERQQQNKVYHGIRAFREAVGLKITKVEKIAIDEDLFEDNMFEGLIFWSGNTPIVVFKQPELYIYPQVLEETKKRVDVSDEFAQILGSKIKGLQYTCAHSARLNFDNGKTVMLCNNYLMDGKNKSVSRYKIIDSNSEHKISVGDKIKNLYFRDDMSYSNYNKKYIAEECFVQLDKGNIFHLYPKVTHKKASLRNEEYDFNMCDRLCKRIKLDNLVVNHIEMKQKACYWMELRNEETYVYIIPSGMWEGETEMHILVYEEKTENPTCCEEKKLKSIFSEYKYITI